MALQQHTKFIQTLMVLALAFCGLIYIQNRAAAQGQATLHEVNQQTQEINRKQTQKMVAILVIWGLACPILYRLGDYFTNKVVTFARRRGWINRSPA